MTQSDAYRLWPAYLNGTLSDVATNQLLGILRENPDMRQEIIDDLELDGAIAQLGIDKNEFMNGFKARLHDDESTIAMVDGVREKISEQTGKEKATIKPESFTQQYLRESAKANWGLRIVAALAASLAIIAGGYWVMNRSGQEHQPQYVIPTTVMASVESFSGKVVITRAGKTVQVESGAQILDQDMITASADGRAEVKYTGEQTSLALLSGTSTKLYVQTGAKLVRLDAGTLVCSIAKQPKDKQMRFITPHAEAVVVGTQLKLAVSNDATHLDVIEGSVKLAKNEQQFVMVNSGESAVVGEGVDLKARPSAPAAPVLQLPLVKANALMVSPTSYYAQWSNGIPTDPDFFPIWVWDQDPDNAKAYKSMGINMCIGPCGPTEKQMAAWNAAGMLVVCDQNEVSMKQANGKTVVGWFNCDEPDLEHTDGFGVTKSPIDIEQVLKKYNILKSRDSSRPVYLALGEGVVMSNYRGRGVRINHPEDYRELVKGADILLGHVFSVNERDPAIRNNLWYVPLAVDNLRTLSADQKPVWSQIETTKVFSDIPARPSLAQVRSEVWMALIHGATGIGYFCDTLTPSFDWAALLRDPFMCAAVSNINHQVASLAPVLNSPTVTDGATVTSGNSAVPVDIMVKKCGDATYVFAVAMRSGETTAIFTVPSGAQVEVLGENRILTVNGGKFSDKFESYAVHLYKLTSQLQARR